MAAAWNLERIAKAFSSSYGEDTGIYSRFARALDGDNEVARFIETLVPDRKLIVLDVGAGPGIVTRRTWRRVKEVHCVEPSEPFREQLTANREGAQWRAYSSVEEFRRLGKTVDVCFSSWADCDVRALADTGNDLLTTDGFVAFLLNFGGCEFAGLWPEDVRQYWIARLDALLGRKFRVAVISSELRFSTIEDARDTMSYFFGSERAMSISKPVIGHNVAVCWRRRLQDDELELIKQRWQDAPRAADEY